MRPVLHVGTVLCLFRQVFSASEFTLLIAGEHPLPICIGACSFHLLLVAVKLSDMKIDSYSESV